ncbi:MAG: histidinol-phosphate transaminase [Burkholderiaceae bacterium]
MSGYHVAPADGLVKLDAMENPYQLPQNLRTQLASQLAALPVNRYPAPDYGELKDIIARVYDIPATARVVLGNGSDELILMLSMAVAGSGQPIVAPAPSFVMYGISGQLAGARFVGVNLTPDLMLDGSAMLAAIAAEQPALVYIAYPNNPTGACFDDEVIERIITRAPGLVVLDEAYFPFAGKTWMQRLTQFPNLIVMRTVSKIGLAGIRIGYLAADPAIAAQLEKVRPPYNISVLDEAAAVFALNHIDVLDEQAALVRGGRQAQADGLAALPGLTVFPSMANFLLVRVPDADKVHAGLLKRRVLVRNVTKMHPLLSNCLRITVSTPQENALLLQAMSETLSSLSTQA